jgi:hypothetical protein
MRPLPSPVVVCVPKRDSHSVSHPNETGSHVRNVVHTNAAFEAMANAAVYATVCAGVFVVAKGDVATRHERGGQAFAFQCLQRQSVNRDTHPSAALRFTG